MPAVSKAADQKELVMQGAKRALNLSKGVSLIPVEEWGLPCSIGWAVKRVVAIASFWAGG